MKRSAIILAMILIMSATAGCRKKAPAPTTMPTARPTTAPTQAPTTAPTTEATTHPTTAPTTAPTTQPEDETIEGGLGDTQETTQEDMGKARRMMPRGF